MNAIPMNAQLLGDDTRGEEDRNRMRDKSVPPAIPTLQSFSGHQERCVSSPQPTCTAVATTSTNNNASAQRRKRAWSSAAAGKCISPRRNSGRKSLTADELEMLQALAFDTSISNNDAEASANYISLGNEHDKNSLLDDSSDATKNNNLELDSTTTTSSTTIQRRHSLRKSIERKSSVLLDKEIGFLQRLADVGKTEHLERAVQVLEKDPAFFLPDRAPETCAQPPPPCLLGNLTTIIERDASFRQELWNDYWQKSSVRSQEHNQQQHIASEKEAEAESTKHNQQDKKDGLPDFIRMLQRFFLRHDGNNNNKKNDQGEAAKVDSIHDATYPLYYGIVGTSANDDSMSSLVLTPPLMDALREHLPFSCRQDLFWIKYSMIRDGASLDTLLRCVRNSARTILAIETISGDVFGSFTSSPWRVNGNSYYGSGEAFLWRLAKSRYALEEDQWLDLESNIEVFRWTGKNRNVQLLPSLESDLVLGGGPPDENDDDASRETGSTSANNNWGFALALCNDLSRGTSQYSVTFNNPSLPTTSNTDVFEVVNIEMWTLTPVEDEQQAEALELSRRFVFDHGNFIES